jgi:hypothetical protein
MDTDWRLGRTVLGIGYGLGWAIQARLWLYSSRLCQLRTVRCTGSRSSHIFIIPSTYLLTGAGRLVTVMSWAPALSRPTDWRWG